MNQTKRNTEFGLVLLGLVILYAGAIYISQTQGDFALSSSLGWLVPTLIIAGMAAPAVVISILFARHHQSAGRGAWLMKGLWALIFSYLWFLVAMITPDFYLPFFEGAKQSGMSGNDAMLILRGDLLPALLFSSIAVIVTQAIYYLLHRKKRI